MSALAQRLSAARAEGRAALIAYLPVGYPSVPGSIAAMQAVVAAGADVIEVGLPYSDPVMDGPVIQRAAQQALAAGVRVRDVFTAVRAVVDAGAVAVVMSYWNPVLRYGVDTFARDLAAAGGSGMITPDLIPDEAQPWLEASQTHGLDRIFLVAPSSTDARLSMTVQACSGFVYVASTMGVTGVRSQVGTGAGELIRRTRAVTDLPLCVGLGVSTGEQAAQVAAYADGVIVGSALVKAMDAAPDGGLDALSALTADLARGVRAGSAT
ncbi:MAG: tryptophan synthase subunit alpha [Austwickia sp.]|nr:tryptophan synthase subunit alpha [Austwickia sp.]